MTSDLDRQCPLDVSAQNRNLFVFAACTCVQYLAAPVLYVGITQASLCERLEASTRVSNLPATLYFAMTAMPVVYSLISTRVAALRRNIMLCYLTTAAMLGFTALALNSSAANSWKIAVVVLQGAVAGAVMPAAIAMLWELIGRGTDQSRRGLALGMAFGIGPLLAVVGSFVQTWCLGGELFFWKFRGVEYPTNFVLLFGLGAPTMVLAAIFAYFAVVPDEANANEDGESTRDRNSAAQIAFSERHIASRNDVNEVVVGIATMIASIVLAQVATEWESNALGALGYVAAGISFVAFGYHFRETLSQRVLLWATIVTILVYCGNMIPSNMNLFSPEVLGDEPSKYAGVQNILRFGFKTLTGLALGYLLIKTSPRAGLIATSLIFLAAPIWATCATGTAYLVAFGIYGAGELVGVYAPNYIVSASRTKDLRRNTAFLTLLMCPVAPIGYLFGAIVDSAKRNNFSLWGMTPAASGFRLSFLACAVCILAGIVLALVALPKHPKPG